MDGHPEVGAVPRRLFDGQIRGDTGDEHPLDPTAGQEIRQIITRQTGELLVVDHMPGIGVRAHLVDQLRARGIRPEQRLRLAHGRHERRVPHQLPLTN
jgi:hypothetical protein